jgi:hypothetical protein
LYSGISHQTWYNYHERPEFVEVIKFIRAQCRKHQTDGATSGVYKENIISRLLGLAEKHDIDAKVDSSTSVVFNFGLARDEEE